MAVSIIALVVAVAGVGVAAIPGSDGKITSCFNKKSGALRVVDAKKKCRKGEKRVAWNQTGPQGIQGTQGPQGDQGTPGSDAQFNGAAAAGDLTGTYPAPEVKGNAIGSAEVAPNALNATDIDEGSFNLNTPIVDARESGNCTLTTAEFISCAQVDVDGISGSSHKFLVIATASWYGTAGSGANDEGSCAISWDEGGETYQFGQTGDEHNDAGTAARLAFQMVMEAGGDDTFRLNCIERVGQVVVNRARISVVRLAD